MHALHIKKIVVDAKIPQYAHPGDAGLDLYAVEDLAIKPGETKQVKTGIAMAIPQGYVGLIWDKSGIALKNLVHSMGGVIDAGYRGEILIVLRNFGHVDFVIGKHMKVAQMLIQPVSSYTIVEVDGELAETSRGSGGFGSTGLR